MKDKTYTYVDCNSAMPPEKYDKDADLYGSDVVDFHIPREEIKGLSGVDIMKNENEYKGMYDILVELASVWDNMKSDETRSRVAEILGGATTTKEMER